VDNIDFYSLFCYSKQALTFDYSHAIEWKEREFEHGSPIGNSTANLKGIGKPNGIFTQRLQSAPLELPSAICRQSHLAHGSARAALPGLDTHRWKG